MVIMSRSTISQREHAILCNLRKLPQKILSLHSHDRITDLVLHNLCGQECFNFRKAAYLVDNPDFNCLKGVSGFYQQDCGVLTACNIWESPDECAERIRNLPFNAQVRDIELCSLKKGMSAELQLAREIAEGLEMNNPQFCVWSLKYGNHGLLIFEKLEDEYPNDYVTDGCSLLGFCPIF